jgi:hypothetical protein
MDATLILIDSDDKLLRARALVDQLWNSNDPANVARLEAQARLRVRKSIPPKGKSTTCGVLGPTLTLVRSQFAQTPNGFPQPKRFFPEGHLRETVKRTEIV